MDWESCEYNAKGFTKIVRDDLSLSVFPHPSGNGFSWYVQGLYQNLQSGHANTIEDAKKAAEDVLYGYNQEMGSR